MLFDLGKDPGELDNLTHTAKESRVYQRIESLILNNARLREIYPELKQRELQRRNKAGAVLTQ